MRKWCIKCRKPKFFWETYRFVELEAPRIDSALNLFSRRYPKYIIEEVYVDYKKRGI